MKAKWFIIVLICTSLISLLSNDSKAQATMNIVDNEASVEITTTVSKATTIAVNSGILARQDSWIVLYHNGNTTIIDVEYVGSQYTLYVSVDFTDSDKTDTVKTEIMSSTRVADIRTKAKSLIKEM